MGLNLSFVPNRSSLPQNFLCQHQHANIAESRPCHCTWQNVGHPAEVLNLQTRGRTSGGKFEDFCLTDEHCTGDHRWSERRLRASLVSNCRGSDLSPTRFWKWLGAVRNSQLADRFLLEMSWGCSPSLASRTLWSALQPCKKIIFWVNNLQHL